MVGDDSQAQLLTDGNALRTSADRNGAADWLAKCQMRGVQVEFHDAIATGNTDQTDGRERSVSNLIRERNRGRQRGDRVAAGIRTNFVEGHGLNHEEVDDVGLRALA